MAHEEGRDPTAIAIGAYIVFALVALAALIAFALPYILAGKKALNSL